MAETGHEKILTNTTTTKGRKIFSGLIASDKFLNVVGAFHHPALVSYYQALYSNNFPLSILWTVYYLSVFGNMRHMMVVVVYEVVVTGYFGLKKVHFIIYLLLKVIV